MKVKSQKDFWSGLMFLVVGVAFAWGALECQFGSSARPGPGYFPFGLGLLMALLGAFILFESLTIETEDGERIGDIAWKPLLIILLSVVLFGVLLPWAGMVVALPVLVITTSLASDEFTWVATLVSSAFLTVFSWLVFIKGLGLTIPLWPSFIAAAA